MHHKRFLIMSARKTRRPLGGGDEGRNIAESAEPTLLIKNPPRYHALQGGVGFIALAMAGVLLVVAGCKQVQKPTPSIPTPPPAQNVNQPSDQEDAAMMEKKAMDKATPLVLKEQNKSGQGGTVKIFDVNGNAKVVLAVTGGAASVAQPAHIHIGSCVTLGPVKYGLSNVVGGKSETQLDVSTAQILSELPLAVNVHKSNAEVGTYVACVEIPKEGTVMKDKDEGAAMEKVKTFDLTGRNFAFSQNDIRVKKGDTVKIKFTRTEGFHDWVLNEFNAATTQAGAGNTSEVQFVADKTGTFEFYCSVGAHRSLGMKGKLIVE